MSRKEGKKTKRPNKTPSRTKYWAQRRLEKHKVNHLMKSNGMTEGNALTHWRKERKGRVVFDLFK